MRNRFAAFHPIWAIRACTTIGYGNADYGPSGLIVDDDLAGWKVRVRDQRTADEKAHASSKQKKDGKDKQFCESVTSAHSAAECVMNTLPFIKIVPTGKTLKSPGFIDQAQPIGYTPSAAFE